MTCNGVASAYLIADQIRSKLVCSHGHLQRLVVLGWYIYVAHKEAGAAHNCSETWTKCAILLPEYHEGTKTFHFSPMTEGEILVEWLGEVESKALKEFGLEGHCTHTRIDDVFKQVYTEIPYQMLNGGTA